MRQTLKYFNPLHQITLQDVKEKATKLNDKALEEAKRDQFEARIALHDADQRVKMLQERAHQLARA